MCVRYTHYEHIEAQGQYQRSSLKLCAWFIWDRVFYFLRFYLFFTSQSLPPSQYSPHRVPPQFPFSFSSEVGVGVLIPLLGVLPGYCRWPLQVPYFYCHASQRRLHTLIPGSFSHPRTLALPRDSPHPLVAADFHSLSWIFGPLSWLSPHLILKTPFLSLYPPTHNFLLPSASYDYFKRTPIADKQLQVSGWIQN